MGLTMPNNPIREWNQKNQMTAPSYETIEQWADLIDQLQGDYGKLYHAVNLMMAELGAEGEINTRHTKVDQVMDALHDIDGGVYDESFLKEPPK